MVVDTQTKGWVVDVTDDLTAASPELLMAVGRMAANFNMLERFTELACIQTLGATDMEAAEIVMADIPFAALVTKFQALARRQADDSTKAEALEDLRGRLNAVGERRNRFVHALWEPAEAPRMSTATRYTARRKGGFVADVSEWSAADINDLAAEIEVLGHEVLE